MTSLLTPGLYRRPLDPVRTPGRPSRGDIPVLLGYAVRGPVGAPVRICSLGQFESVFGHASARGYLWHSLKGFFETGGRTAYVVRVATAQARAACADPSPGTEGPLAWRAEASFPWTMIDPRRLRGPDLADDAQWVQAFERQLLEHGRRSPDPGTWGNGLSVDVRRTARVRTVTVPDPGIDGTSSRLASLAGLEAASVLELVQGPCRATLVPRSVDTERQLVHWDDHLGALGFRPEQDIRITSAEFDVVVRLGDKVEQSFEALSPHPAHSASIAGVTEARCRALTLRPVVRRLLGEHWVDEAPEPGAEVLARADWADPASWPPEGTHRLGGGTDDLENMCAAAWERALSGTAQLADAAMIAAPDLVLAGAAAAEGAEDTDAVTDCSDLSPRPLAQLEGTVKDTEASEHDGGLAGVTVDVAGPGGTTTTDTQGKFTLSAIEEGLVTLRLRKPGYEPLDFLAQSSPFHSAPQVQINLTRIVTPRPLDSQEVLRVQRAMSDPSHVGPHKIAFLDPPAADSRLDEIATWRARLEDNARIGYFAPWLTLPILDASGHPLACPPSGHVCGAFAAAENATGIHRTGANLPLRYVDGTTLGIDDAEQATLNPVGINAIRVFPGRGVRVHGSRSLSTDPQWRFLTARRIVDAVEKALERALQWAVFEPNNLITRQSVATTAATVLGRLHREGVLAGTVPEAAFSVRCDLENNPPDSRDAGLLVVDIAVAPTTPYEFVLFRIGRTLDALHVTENP